MRSSGQLVVRVELSNVPVWDSVARRKAHSRLAGYVARGNRCRFPRLNYGFGIMVLLFEIDAKWIDELTDVARELATYVGLDDDSFDSATIETEDAVQWQRDVFGSGII